MPGHHVHGRGSIATLVIVLLIVAHALFFSVATRLHYFGLLAAVVVGIVLLKYLWWKRSPFLSGGSARDELLHDAAEHLIDASSSVETAKQPAQPVGDEPVR